MALNIAHPIEKKTASLGFTQEFKNKFHITVNEPTQTHFSVEGVQTYTTEQIKALKVRAERVGTYANKEGKFLELNTYKIDDQMQFLETVPPNRQRNQPAVKPKVKSRLQSAKPQEAKVDQNRKKPIKPSIRNQLGRANQKTVKITKQQQKLRQMEDKLSDLTKKYKQHFGNDLKPSKGRKQKVEQAKSDAKEKSYQNSSHQKQQKEQNDISENQDFPEFEEDQGEQALPQAQKAGKSLASVTKPGDKDDSFEEVEWEGRSQQQSFSRLKASTYSQKLGNAVHLLFG